MGNCENPVTTPVRWKQSTETSIPMFKLARKKEVMCMHVCVFSGVKLLESGSFSLFSMGVFRKLGIYTETNFCISLRKSQAVFIF